MIPTFFTLTDLKQDVNIQFHGAGAHKMSLAMSCSNSEEEENQPQQGHYFAWLRTNSQP